MRDHTFFAELHLRRPTGRTVMSSRPSDAMALAVRCEAPIFANEELLDEVGAGAGADEPEEEAEEIIDEFRDFIEHVNPEDFADG